MQAEIDASNITNEADTDSPTAEEILKPEDDIQQESQI